MFVAIKHSRKIDLQHFRYGYGEITPVNLYLAAITKVHNFAFTCSSPIFMIESILKSYGGTEPNGACIQME